MQRKWRRSKILKTLRVISFGDGRMIRQDWKGRDRRKNLRCRYCIEGVGTESALEPDQIARFVLRRTHLGFIGRQVKRRVKRLVILRSGSCDLARYFAHVRRLIGHCKLDTLNASQ